MSIETMGWVLKNSEETLGRRLTLLALADHANEDGSGAWPSVETLSRHTRLSPRQVRRCLRDLEASGSIVRLGKSEYGTSIYNVSMEPRTICPPDISDSETVVNVRQPVIEPSRSNTPQTPHGGTDAVQAIFDHWRTVMDHPEARLDAVRRRMIERALKHSTPADCCRAINGCANSDFHMARGDNKGGTRYDALSLILRNREKVEWFMSLAPAQGGVSDEEKRAIIAVRAGRDLAASGEMADRAIAAATWLTDRGWTIYEDYDGMKFDPPAKTGGEGLTPPS